MPDPLSNIDPKQRSKRFSTLADTNLRLAADLDAMKRLNVLAQKLTGKYSLENGLKEILAVAVEFTATDRGDIRLLLPGNNSFQIVAHQGLSQAFLDRQKYNACNSICGVRFKSGERIVVEDTRSESAPRDAPDLEAFEEEGIRAMQSTMLTTQQSEVIGVMSTYFIAPCRPSTEQFALIDLLAAMTAEFIERAGIEEVRDRQQKQAEEQIGQFDRRQRDLEEWQQQQIVRAILHAQEEERRRIAESLHNSLGQLLYGVKLSLGQVLKSDLPDKDKQNLRNTDKLLTQAIMESRRMSHELMPTILEDFGLKSAVEDICRQLSNGVKIRCHFKGLQKRLDKYIETAVYRIVQELLMNIVKHAGATEALAAIEVSKSSVLILVQDNGKGFDTQAGKGDGIGLKTIRNKISLLKGNINIVSIPGEGTLVNIDVPVVVDK